MTPVDAILVLATWLLLLFPGMLLLFGALPRRSLGEVFFIGGVVGWCMQILLLRFFDLSAWPFVTGFLYAVTSAVAFYTMRQASGEGPKRLPGGHALWVPAVMALAALVPLAMAGDLPPGERSMFHMLLVKKAFLDGFIPQTLLPVASIPINTPAGTHLWVALTAKLAGIEPHQSFKMAFPAIAFFSAGTIYLLALEIFDGDKYVAFFSSLLFLLASSFGGKTLFIEGRLPHFMGMLLLMCLLWFMLAEPRLRGRLFMGLVGAGMLYCQSHTVLVASALAAGAFMIERTVHGRPGDWSKSLLMAAGVAVALAPEQALGGLGLLFNPDATDLYAYREVFVPLRELIGSPGQWLAFTGTAGLVLLFFRLKTDRRLLLAAWFAALLGMLAVFGYLYRVFAFGLEGEFYAMFTPSALMQSLKYPLFLTGGWFIASREGFFKLRAVGLATFMAAMIAAGATSPKGGEIDFGHLVLKQLGTILITGGILLWLASAFRENKIFQHAAAAALTLVLVLYGAMGTRMQLHNFANIMAPPEKADKQVLKKLVPSYALVMNRPANPFDRTLYGWTPYLTWADCTHIMLPSTEPRRSREMEYKKKILERDFFEMQIQGHLQAKPVVLLTQPGANYRQLGFRGIYRSGRRKVNIYEP